MDTQSQKCLEQVLLLGINNVCFSGKIRKISILSRWKKCLIWSYEETVSKYNVPFFHGTYTQEPITYYRIYPKYLDTSTSYCKCSKIWTSTIHYPMLCLKIAGWVANSVDPDETPRSVASHLGLNCLLRHVCPNTYGKYGISICFLKYNQNCQWSVIVWTLPSVWTRQK